MFSQEIFNLALSKKHSTTTCSFLLRETIKYFNMRGSLVFSCFMDVSKAFDRISRDKLFGILKDRGLNPLILRLLEYRYTYKNLKAELSEDDSYLIHLL